MNNTAHKKSRIPKFTSYEEEAAWWDTHDVADYLDEFEEPQFVVADKSKKVKSIFITEDSKLNSSLNIRFEETTLEEIRSLADEKGIGPTTLIRMWTLEKLHEGKKHLVQNKGQ